MRNRPYSAAEERVIRQWYHHIGPKACARMLELETGSRRSPHGLGIKARKMGLIYEGPLLGGFSSAKRSWNTGKPMSAETRAKCQGTMFKRGQQPHNTKQDGAITIRDANRRPTPYIRIGSGKWQQLARYNYEQAHGPIPPSHVVRHRDEDPMNCAPENLYLVSRAEMVKLNSNREKFGRTMRLIWQERKLKRHGLSFVDAVLKCII